MSIFNKEIILDYNEEGNENVPSEDFAAGFGCVPIEEEKTLLPPPPVKSNWTENDWENFRYMMESDDEKQNKEDQFLSRHKI